MGVRRWRQTAPARGLLAAWAPTTRPPTRPAGDPSAGGRLARWTRSLAPPARGGGCRTGPAGCHTVHPPTPAGGRVGIDTYTHVWGDGGVPPPPTAFPCHPRPCGPPPATARPGPVHIVHAGRGGNGRRAARAAPLHAPSHQGMRHAPPPSHTRRPRGGRGIYTALRVATAAQTKKKKESP